MPWSLLLNRWVLIGIAFAAVSAYAGFEHWQAGRWEDKYVAFVAETKAAGVAAQAKAKEIETANKERKDKADADHAATVASLNADIERLRNERASRRYLPAPAAGSPSPERTCLSTADAERAIRDFIEAASGLVAEGDRAIADLNAAKEWAQKP